MLLYVRPNTGRRCDDHLNHCSCPCSSSPGMGDYGSSGHHRRFGVSGFIRGRPLYSLQGVEQPPRTEEEDDEQRYDRMHGVKSSSGASARKRPHDHEDNADEDEDGDPSELYSRLVASSSAVGAEKSSARKKNKKGGFMCEVCGVQITAVAKGEHERSTLHIFNEKKKDTARRIVLPDSNRGVQILGRIGWSGETGLGVAEQGRIEPAKSILKLDKKGLGHKQPKARVTHFPPHIPVEEGKSAAERAVEELERRKQKEKQERSSVMRRLEGQPESKQERKRREGKEKRQLDRIRREFNDHVPEGYEEYF